MCVCLGGWGVEEGKMESKVRKDGGDERGVPRRGEEKGAEF